MKIFGRALGSSSSQCPSRQRIRLLENHELRSIFDSARTARFSRDREAQTTGATQFIFNLDECQRMVPRSENEFFQPAVERVLRNGDAVDGADQEHDPNDSGRNAGPLLQIDA